MRKIIVGGMLLTLTFYAASAQAQGKKNAKAAKNGVYGIVITKEGAIDVKSLPEKMEGQHSMPIKIVGDVVAACQVKGCWMTADLGDNKTMRIRFKDYGFFVPKNCAGKTFYAQGIASWDTTSVEELRHYAQDAGKPQEEIEKITSPQFELNFLAEGVLLEAKLRE